MRVKNDKNRILEFANGSKWFDYDSIRIDINILYEYNHFVIV